MWEAKAGIEKPLELGISSALVGKWSGGLEVLEEI